ncbi:MAG: hypothetical protein IKR53_03730, partial [Clostridia bacterium]|nr:hypothetical protein [Clostridia bacterium]
KEEKETCADVKVAFFRLHSFFLSFFGFIRIGSLWNSITDLKGFVNNKLCRRIRRGVTPFESRRDPYMPKNRKIPGLPLTYVPRRGIMLLKPDNGGALRVPERIDL